MSTDSINILAVSAGCNTVNSFNFVGTNFRALGKKGISWDS